METKNRKSIILGVLDEIVSLPKGTIPSDTVIQDVILAWDNGGWPAQLSYIQDVLKACIAHDKPVLECGSGVTSLIVGAVLKRRRIEIHSLEHEKDWVDQVNYYKQHSKLTNLNVHYCPLKTYGDYDWYSVPDDLPDNFSVVICDGPPGATRGGRFGLVPCMINKLSGAVVFLDDFDRPGEQAVVKKWRDGWDVDIKAQKSATQAFGKGFIPTKH